MERDDPVWLEASSRWLKLRSEIAHLEEEERKMRDQLISMSNNASAIGGGVRLVRTTRKGAVQYAQIPELKGLDLDQYRKDPIEVWILTATS